MADSTLPVAEDPTPESILRQTRQQVDDALSAVASSSVEQESAAQRVAELASDLEHARTQESAAATSRGERIQALHTACDASVTAIEAIKGAYPLG